jgi:type II secretory pathway pseudopilin PulG
MLIAQNDPTTLMTTTTPIIKKGEAGMTLIAVMGMMVILATALLAVAPTVVQDVQREKELESIRRGEEVARAIEAYVIYYRGTKLPESIDDLLEGLPQGTRNRMILRPSAATDPLSEDGKWRLIQPEPQQIANLAKRIQDYNNGILPSNPSQIFDRWAVVIVNNVTMPDDSEATEPDPDYDEITDNVPFIGVASQSRSKSILTYYGAENHSKWIYTPLFRGSGASRILPMSSPTPRRAPGF